MDQYSREVCFSWLCSAGLSPAQMKTLLDVCGNEPQSLLEKVSQGDITVFDKACIPERAVSALRKIRTNRNLDRWAKLLEQFRIHACSYLDSEYPERLLPLEDCPAVLFYIGKMIPTVTRTAAVVGSRSASWKGLRATEKITQELSSYGVAVISGLAYGIDAAAHRGCLKGGSPTVAVMGCGLDQAYPIENEELKRQILERDGLLLSEYAPGEKPLGWHFPIRNRIISGLADCVILMEARIRSGSMTTVQHALEQGRDVFVYPGEADSLKSEGNHQLLREGAIFFTTSEDILEDMHWLDKKKEVRQNNDCISGKEKLNAAEKAVLSVLQKGPMSLDQLCDALNRDAGPMMAQLTMMQISGLIETLPGKQFGIKAE